MNVKHITGLFLTLFFVFLQQANSQTQTVEMLEHKLKQTSQDSLRLHLIKKIAVAFRNSDPAKQLHYSYTGLQLALESTDVRHELLFYRELGIHHKKAGHLDSALFYYEKAQVLALEISDLPFYQATNISLGNLKKTQGKYEEAVGYFLKVLSYYESETDNRSQSVYLTALFNLAGTYVRLKEYDKALGLFKTVVEHPLTQRNKSILRGSYTNLLAVYIKTHQPDSALFYAEKAKEIALQTNSTRSLAYIYTNMGVLYEQKETYGRAAEAFKKARSLFSQLNDKPGIAKSENNIGNIYSKQGLFTDAERALLKARMILKESTDTYSLEHNYAALISLYRKQGDFRKAYDFQTRFYALKDSLTGLDKVKAIEEIETKYEVQKKELLTKNAVNQQKLAEAKAQKSQLYLAFGSAGGSLMLLSSTLYLFLFRARKKRELLSLELGLTQKQLQTENQYRQSELKAIKAQMSPHFLFNAINSVQSLILKGDKHEAYRYLSKFSALTRQNLRMSEKDFVYFDQELELITNYLELEKLRFDQSLSYQITGTSDLLEVRVYPMIIQPFLENAIKHGLFHKTGAKTLRIHFEKATALTCTIEDNGIGRQAAGALQQQQAVRHDSFAMAAIEKQLELLSYQFETEFGFSITDIEEQGEVAGTRIVLNIPYLSDHE